MSNALWTAKVNVRLATTNPLLRLIIMFVAIFEFLLGVRRKGILNEYQEKLTIQTTVYVFWFFKSSESVLSISKSRISGVEVNYRRSFIFFKVVGINVYAAGVTLDTGYDFKGISYKEVAEKTEGWL